MHSRPRVGTRVSALEEWHLLDPDVLSWVFSGEPEQEVIHGVFELRSIVEPAAAALAAARRSQVHLDRMRRALDEMARHTLHVEAGRIADKEFHAALLLATANPFIVSLTNGVTAAVDSLTEFKQRIAPLKRDPIPDHLRVYDAIAAKDARGCARRDGRAHPARDHGHADQAASQRADLRPAPRASRNIHNDSHIPLALRPPLRVASMKIV